MAAEIIQNRKATMRHTATLEVEQSYRFAHSVAGCNLASGVESLLDWEHLGAEELREELRKLLGERKAVLQEASSQRERAGANVDGAKFADEA